MEYSREIKEADLLAFYRRAKLDPKPDTQAGKSLLGQEFRLFVFYAARLYGIYSEEELVSISAVHFGTGKRKNAWGRYVNWYGAYTLPSERYKGYATRLQLSVEGVAVGEGYQRVKSLVRSVAGVRLHMALGHQFWGVNKRGEIVVDSPLLGCAEAFPSGIPMEARAAVSPQLMDGEAVARVLSDPAGVFMLPPWAARGIAARSARGRVECAS